MSELIALIGLALLLAAGGWLLLVYLLSRPVRRPHGRERRR